MALKILELTERKMIIEIININDFSFTFHFFSLLRLM